MKIFYFLAFCLLLAGPTRAAFPSPSRPDCIGSEAAIKEWVEKAVHDTPPVGGDITMLKHWKPKYAKNERVGEIWIVASLVKVSLDGKSDHEMAFVVYHVDTRETSIEAEFGVPEDQVDNFLNDAPSN